MLPKTIAILLVLGLFVLFGLSYLPMPEAGEAIQQSQQELLRLNLFMVLLVAWGAIMTYWRISSCRQIRPSKIGATFVVLALSAAFALNYWLMPTPAGLVDVEQYEVVKRYEMLVEYPLLTSSAFVLLIVGVTMVCWRSGERRTVNIVPSPIEAPAAVDEQATSHIEPPAGSPPSGDHVRHKRARQRV